MRCRTSDAGPPDGQTYTPSARSADRIIDKGAARRMVTLRTSDGRPVPGQVLTDGGGWSITPTAPWREGDYSLVVDPELKDISGNALGAAFDATAGTIGTVQSALVLLIDIAP